MAPWTKIEQNTASKVQVYLKQDLIDGQLHMAHKYYMFIK